MQSCVCEHLADTHICSGKDIPLCRPVSLAHRGSGDGGWPVPGLAFLRGDLHHCTFCTRHPHLKGTKTIPGTMSNSDTKQLHQHQKTLQSSTYDCSNDWEEQKLQWSPFGHLGKAHSCHLLSTWRTPRSKGMFSVSSGLKINAYLSRFSKHPF